MTKPIETREAAILTELQQLKDLKTDAQKQIAKDNYLKLSQAYAHMHMDPQLLKSWAANTAINKNSFTHEGKIYYTYGLNFITGDRTKYEARLNSLKDSKEFATKLLLELTQYETKLSTISTYYMDGKKEMKQSHIDGIRAIKKIIDGKIGWADGLMSHMDDASRAQYNAFKARYFGEILTGIDPKYMIVPKALESKKQTTTLGYTHEVVDPAKDAANFSASKADWMVKQWMNAGPTAALNQLKNLHARLDDTENYTDAQVRNIQVYTQALHRSMANVLTTQLSQAKNQGAIESAQKNIIQFAALITGKTAGDDFSTKVQSWLGTNGVDDRFIDEATASSVLKQALMKNSVESMGYEVAQEVHTELQSDARGAVSSLKTTKLTVDPITGQTSNQSVYDFLISHRFFTDLPGALTKGYTKTGSDKVRGDLSAVIAMQDYITSESKQGVSMNQLIQEICANPRELWQGSIGGQAQGIVDAKVDDILGGGSAKKKFFTSEYWTGKNIAGLTGQQKKIYNLYKDVSGAGALDRSTSSVKMSQDMIKGALPTLIAIPLIASGFGAPAGVALIGGTVVGTSAYWAMDGRKFNSTKEMLIDRGSEMGLNVATAWGGAKIAKYGANVAGKYLAGKSNALIKIPLESSKIPSHVAQVMKAGDEVSQVALMTTKGIKPIGFAINSAAALADAGLGMGAEVFRQNLLLENEQSFKDVFISPQGAVIAVMSIWGAASGGDTKHAIIKANVEYLDGYVKAHPEARNIVIDLQDGHFTTLGRVHDQILKPAMQGKFTDSQGYVHLPDKVTSDFVAGVQEYGKLGIKSRKTTTNIDLVEAKKTIRKEVVENASLTRDAKLSKLEGELKSQGLLTESLTADQKVLLREIEDVGGDVYMLTAEQRAQKLSLAQSDKAKALFGDKVDQIMRYAMDEGYLGQKGAIQFNKFITNFETFRSKHEIKDVSGNVIGHEPFTEQEIYQLTKNAEEVNKYLSDARGKGEDIDDVLVAKFNKFESQLPEERTRAVLKTLQDKAEKFIDNATDGQKVDPNSLMRNDDWDPTGVSVETSYNEFKEYYAKLTREELGNTDIQKLNEDVQKHYNRYKRNDTDKGFTDEMAKVSKRAKLPTGKLVKDKKTGKLLDGGSFVNDKGSLINSSYSTLKDLKDTLKEWKNDKKAVDKSAEICKDISDNLKPGENWQDIVYKNKLDELEKSHQDYIANRRKFGSGGLSFYRDSNGGISYVAGLPTSDKMIHFSNKEKIIDLLGISEEQYNDLKGDFIGDGYKALGKLKEGNYDEAKRTRDGDIKKDYNDAAVHNRIKGLIGDNYAKLVDLLGFRMDPEGWSKTRLLKINNIKDELLIQQKLDPEVFIKKYYVNLLHEIELLRTIPTEKLPKDVMKEASDVMERAQTTYRKENVIKKMGLKGIGLDYFTETVKTAQWTRDGILDLKKQLEAKGEKTEHLTASLNRAKALDRAAFGPGGDIFDFEQARRFETMSKVGVENLVLRGDNTMIGKVVSFISSKFPMLGAGMRILKEKVGMAAEGIFDNGVGLGFALVTYGEVGLIGAVGDYLFTYNLLNRYGASWSAKIMMIMLRLMVGGAMDAAFSEEDKPLAEKLGQYFGKTYGWILPDSWRNQAVFGSDSVSKKLYEKHKDGEFSSEIQQLYDGNETDQKNLTEVLAAIDTYEKIKTKLKNDPSSRAAQALEYLDKLKEGDAILKNQKDLSTWEKMKPLIGIHKGVDKSSRNNDILMNAIENAARDYHLIENKIDNKGNKEEKKVEDEKFDIEKEMNDPNSIYYNPPVKTDPTDSEGSTNGLPSKPTHDEYGNKIIYENNNDGNQKYDQEYYF